MARNQFTLELSEEDKKILFTHFPEGMVGVDLETTGLSPLIDHIIEIGAVKIDKNGTVHSFHQLIKPPMPVPEHTIGFHGLTDDMLKDAPSLGEGLLALYKFIEELPIVAHNAQFDLGFLIKGLHLLGYTNSKNSVFDSCRLARVVVPKGEEDGQTINFKLSTLAQYFKLDLQHHQALDDASKSLQILLRCLGMLEEEKRSTYIEQRAKVYQLEQFKKGRGFEVPHKLKGMFDFVQKQTPIEIEYTGGENPGYRSIRPLAIIPLPLGPILYAECINTKQNKSYLLKKIKNFQELKNEYLPLDQQK